MPIVDAIQLSAVGSRAESIRPADGPSIGFRGLTLDDRKLTMMFDQIVFSRGELVKLGIDVRRIVG